MSMYTLSQLKPVMTTAQVREFDAVKTNYDHDVRDLRQVKREMTAILSKSARTKSMSRFEGERYLQLHERALDLKETMLALRAKMRDIVIPAKELVASHTVRPAVAVTPRSGSAISSILQSFNQPTAPAVETPKSVEDVVATVARLTGKSVEDVAKEAKVLVDAIKSGAFKGLAGMLLKSKI